MLQEIYKWIQDIVFYLVIVTAVLEVLPGTNYQKYIRFFSGLILILLLFTPFLKLSGARPLFHELYKDAKKNAVIREEDFTDRITESGEIFDFLQEQGTMTGNDGQLGSDEELKNDDESENNGRDRMDDQTKTRNQIKIELGEIEIGESLE